MLYVGCPICCPMVSYTELREKSRGLRQPRHRLLLNGIDWAAKVISVGALAGLTTVVMVLVLGLSR